MKFIQNLFFSLLLLMLIHSCVIEEHYHFNADMTGTYTMDFDYSLLASEDSSGEMKESMSFFSDSLYDAMEGYAGLSNIQKENKEHGFILSYDFNSIDVLNEVETKDDPSKKEVFMLSKKGMYISQFSDLKDLDEFRSKIDDGATDEEMAEMMNKMFQVKTRISFAKDVKVKKMKHFKEVEKNTFEYSSQEEGFNVEPMLDVKFTN